MEIRERDLHLRDKGQNLREGEFDPHTINGQLEREKKEERRDAVDV
jgi:hypothetical protein